MPVLTVVGSKGKGTAATYASAFLAATGARVVTVTSPGLRSNRERIRVDGAAISAAELEALGERISRGLQQLPGRDELPGHLAPAGLFTAAGVLHAKAAGADYLVLEAGMGGGSDEVSLFPPNVAAMTEIFAEHVGVLGDTVVEIAQEKARVISGTTAAVLSLPQQPAVQEAIQDFVSQRANLRVDVLDTRDGTLPSELLPPSYGRWNAELGCSAAARLLSLLGRELPDPGKLRQVLESVKLPGRLSRHFVPGSKTEIYMDSAISGAGVATALRMVRRNWDHIDHVLVCLPDHKDVEGAVLELAGYPVTFVRLSDPHFSFTRSLPENWAVVEEDKVTPAFLSGLGEHVLSLGTVFFSGRMLNVLNAPTERLFTA
ncbi:Mur ligase family protein [Acrocarpospora phusangensis]|uniref:Mur ligase family protein n=1 Tax=Acrocarpospora phusangensis TaxID=1070424 RepID=UPI001EF36209|nr:Mur ligase family protein [Acrocarpospora phusangensis]